MDTGVRRGLGLALVGVVTWGVVALVAVLLRDDELPLAIETVIGLIALIGIVVLIAGLGRVAWVLLRR